MLNPDEGPTHQAIRDAVDALPQKTAMRPRDMATRIGVSEAELIAATAGPSGRRVAKRLPDVALAIVERLPSLGQVMALTRNKAAVHEKVGTYGELEGDSQVAGIYGDHIDLRLFLKSWRYSFAFEEPNSDSEFPKRSLQFFDTNGHAVHKVHLRPESNHAAFEQLVADMAGDTWEDDLAVEPMPQQKGPDRQQDATGLKMAWRELQNVHDFHLLLRRFEIDRLDALRCVSPEFAYETAPTAHRGLMETAAETGLPIMVFVNNRGCTQIHTGPIQELKGMGAWWNILDPGFNLHLKEDEIGSSWVVKKPTERGQVTSYEVYDRNGQLVLTLFGRREKGQPENPVWRELAESTASKEAR
ncbi:MAG: ChuX/HutX family heme-like substrate-binding protein [Pseudomonadota bacterium]